MSYVVWGCVANAEKKNFSQRRKDAKAKALKEQNNLVKVWNKSCAKCWLI